LANVYRASFGERLMVPGSSSLIGSPPFFVFGMTAPFVSNRYPAGVVL
jgi:hypothetical protein